MIPVGALMAAVAANQNNIIRRQREREKKEKERRDKEKKDKKNGG